jgi:2-polyprenyl-3-methyl-5-hydroxy-6-metoxy-1,4-benzoquinol methylase
MPLFLRTRAPHLHERMDDPACDPARLHATYARFGAVNRLFAGWGVLYRRFLRPRFSPGGRYRLLDIGFGGGDIPYQLVRWAERDGVALQVTAIDPDPRALRYACTLPPSPQVRFERAHASELAARGERFDVVISNHLLHHLSESELLRLCADSVALGGVVLHNDIARADVAYLGFAALTAPFFRGSYITPDGLTSVRRAFIPEELAALVPAPWRVSRPYPYRLLLSYGL